MNYLAVFALFIPLASFLYLFLFGDSLKRRFIEIIGCLAVLIPFFCFIFLALQKAEGDILLYSWLHLNDLKADFLLHLDHLSLLMALIITGIGFLIHVYSIGYMEEDPGISRYFSCMNLFIFSMLLLVLSGDLLLLFVGWEGVGLASYLLIGFWYEKPSAANAATKAFMVNRIGDFGFLLGILSALHLFGTTNISEITSQPIDSASLTLLTSLLLCGAIAKSAQLPLHVWLPDAMEGPTPVSALIHAATMVTAGVYLIARLHDLYIAAPDVLMWIGIIGGSTALFASLAALNQTDLKRVLAYSTISQLGLMFLACGIGAFYAAMFHLTTHAFIKALLFLTAGNVIHGLHGTTEMDEMGGLSKEMPKTNWLFLIGVLALSGIPPFAAFFSKDLILEAEYELGYQALFIAAVITSILTAFYLTRAYFLAFKGEAKQKAHEAPYIMLIPVAALGILAISGGFLGFLPIQSPILKEYLMGLGITHVEEEFTKDFFTSIDTWLSILMAVFGVGTAAIVYSQFKEKLCAPLAILKKGFYIDDVYRMLVVKPYSALAQLITHGTEPYVFNQLVDLSTIAASKTAYGLAQLQSGQIRSYAAWMLIGGIALLVFLAL